MGEQHASLGTEPEIHSKLVWVVASPAETVPGEWVAHCLDFDIVSQGHSLEHSLEMAKEAILECLNDDAENGLDPFDRSAAPDEDWEDLYHLMKHGVPLDTVPVEKRDQLTLVGAQLRLVQRIQDHHSEENADFVPEPYQVARLSRSSERLSAH